MLDSLACLISRVHTAPYLTKDVIKIQTDSKKQNNFFSTAMPIAFAINAFLMFLPKIKSGGAAPENFLVVMIIMTVLCYALKLNGKGYMSMLFFYLPWYVLLSSSLFFGIDLNPFKSWAYLNVWNHLLNSAPMGRVLCILLTALTCFFFLITKPYQEKFSGRLVNYAAIFFVSYLWIGFYWGEALVLMMFVLLDLSMNMLASKPLLDDKKLHGWTGADMPRLAAWGTAVVIFIYLSSAPGVLSHLCAGEFASAGFSKLFIGAIFVESICIFIWDDSGIACKIESAQTVIVVLGIVIIQLADLRFSWLYIAYPAIFFLPFASQQLEAFDNDQFFISMEICVWLILMISFVMEQQLYLAVIWMVATSIIISRPAVKRSSVYKLIVFSALFILVFVLIGSVYGTSKNFFILAFISVLFLTMLAILEKSGFYVSAQSEKSVSSPSAESKTTSQKTAFLISVGIIITLAMCAVLAIGFRARLSFDSADQFSVSSGDMIEISVCSDIGVKHISGKINGKNYVNTGSKLALPASKGMLRITATDYTGKVLHFDRYLFAH